MKLYDLLTNYVRENDSIPESRKYDVYTKMKQHTLQSSVTTTVQANGDARMN